MSILFRIIVCISVLCILSSCSSVRQNSISRNTTALRVLNPEQKEASNSKKLDKGVYVLIVKGNSFLNEELGRALTLQAAKLTIKQGYKRFVIVQDIKNDEELDTAIKENRVRELYLKRIRKKSPLIGKTRILQHIKHKRSDISVSREMFAVIVMLNKGKQGLPAKRVKYYLENRHEIEHRKEYNQILIDLYGSPFPKKPHLMNPTGR